MSGKNTINIKLIKSKNGRLKKHKECLQGLGLSKIGQTVVREDTPSVRGMVNKISYLLEVN